MKNLILAITLLASANIFAHTNHREAAEAFLKSHQLAFNQLQEPVYCSNPDSLIKILNSQNVNYIVSEYEFIGSVIAEPNFGGVSGKSVTNNKAKAFIAYQIVEREFRTYIIEIAGHNFF